MAKSTRWIPVAVNGPTGACLLDKRQLSLGNAKNLSWLKLASICKIVPKTPASISLRKAMTEGSNLRSWPIPNTRLCCTQLWMARCASLKVKHRGFSQNTCLPAWTAWTIWSACCRCGVQRMTASSSVIFRNASKLDKTCTPLRTASEPICCLRLSSTSTTATNVKCLEVAICLAMIFPHHP